MSRTPEQREADAQLVAAINHREEVYGTDTGILMEWVVMSSRALVLDDGSDATMTDYYGGEHQPIHRTYGLMAWVLERCKASYLYGKEGDVE